MTAGNVGGDWLFRQGELTLGPIPGKILVDKLMSGELNGRSLVAQMGEGTFRPIADISALRVHLAKAEAKARVDAHAQTEVEKRAKARNIKIGVAVAVALVVAGAAAVFARRIAVDNPWKNVEEAAFGEIAISIEPGSIGLARAHNREELVDYPLARRGSGPVASAKGSGGPKFNSEGDEPDGLQTVQFDQAGINSVVASNKKALFQCLLAEAQRTPGLSAKIPIEFTIGNNGKVANVWVDHPAFKSGSLPDCLLKELQKWPFKPYEGEQANVSLSFNVGKKG